METINVHDSAALDLPYVPMGDGGDGKAIVYAAAAAPRTYLEPFKVTVDGTGEPVALDDLPSSPNGEPVLADVFCQGTADGDFVTYWHAPSGDPDAGWPGKRLADGEELASTAPAVLLFELGEASGDCTLMVEPYYYGGS